MKFATRLKLRLARVEVYLAGKRKISVWRAPTASMPLAPTSTMDATSNVSSNFPVKKNAVSQVISVTILIKYENSVIVIKFSYS